MVLIAGTAGSVTLWWRRTHPVLVTLAGIATLAATRLSVVLVVGLFTLAIRRRDRVLVAMTVAAAAALAIDSAVGSSRSWPSDVLSGVITAGLCVAAGSYVGVRRDLVAALRERAVRAEQEQEQRADQARLGERARIAREMHDVVAHKVSLIALHAGALEVQSAPTAEQVGITAGLIRTTAHEAMEDLRKVLGVLRAADGDGSDLAPPPRLDDLVRVVEASRAAGVQAELVVAVGDLPDELARAAHRIVQEALTNVHKHARGAATSVTISGGEADGVTVEVVNRRPVAAGALLPGSGSGLVGLEERVVLLGGAFDAEPTPDGGWRVRAWLPWTPAPAPANVVRPP